MAAVQRSKPECPLCRSPFDGHKALVVNRELRDLISLASALGTVETDGWQAVTSKVLPLALTIFLDTFVGLGRSLICKICWGQGVDFILGTAKRSIPRGSDLFLFGPKVSAKSLASGW